MTVSNTTTFTPSNEGKTKNVIPFTKTETKTSQSIGFQLETDLNSLCSILCVGSSEEFTEYAPDIQLGFLYGCYQLAKKIKDDFQDMHEAQAVEQGKRGAQA